MNLKPCVLCPSKTKHRSRICARHRRRRSCAFSLCTNQSRKAGLCGKHSKLIETILDKKLQMNIKIYKQSNILNKIDGISLLILASTFVKN